MGSYTVLSCIESKVEQPTKFYGRFELGPFVPGQALTVANTLRRSLLSQLSGTAIVVLEIENAVKEYDVLEGIRESILDILLNVKQIILTSDFETFNPQVGFLNVKGPGIVRAGDLKLPSFIYTVDPNQYIATLSDKGCLNMKFIIGCGKNYQTYQPKDPQYQNWISLLEETNSPVSQTLSNVLETDSLNTKQLQISDSFSSIKNPKQKNLKTSELVEKAENSDYLKFEALNSSILDEQLTKKSKKNFYQQWLRERSDFKNHLKKKQSVLQILSSNKIETQTQLKENPNYKLKQLPKAEDSIPKNRNLSETQSRNETSEFISFSKKKKKSALPIDANFMPVTRVNYLIESTENLKISEERIILEIWTNGSIHPRRAIHKAAKALIQLFLPFQQIRTSVFDFSKTYFLNLTKSKKNREKQLMNSAPSKTEKIKTSKKELLIEKEKEINQKENSRDELKGSRLLELDIANLELTVRPYGCLKTANINTVGNLISYSEKELLSLKNFGVRSLKEVKNALQLLNLSLRKTN